MIVEVKNLVKRYDRLVALDHININVMEGEVFGLLGPNGSGKSTLINCILSLAKYDKGFVRVFNQEMNMEAYTIKRDIGVVMQDIGIFRELTVYENIQYFCSLYIKDINEVKERTEEVIKLLVLEDFQTFLPKKLSDGLLRRVNIACGIVHKPKLIFMDEPVLSADPYSRTIIFDVIRNLNDQGNTIIYSTHSMEEVEQLCTRIAMVDKGRIIASGSKDELKAMISLGEKITLEVYKLTEKEINELLEIPSISDLQYKNNILEIRSKKGRNNLIHVLDYVTKHGLNVGKIYTELPALNDVFLEITGKEI